MQALFEGRQFEVAARGVPATEDHSMPNYVRLEYDVYPASFYVLLTPADARFLAAELNAAADAAALVVRS